MMSSTVFADSPPPHPSKVTVHLEINGQPETTITQITYICPQEKGNSTTKLYCVNGTCNNDPNILPNYCAYFPEGYFSYQNKGQNKTSEKFNNTGHYDAEYDFTLDVSSGRIKQNEIPKPQPTCCFPAGILALIGVSLRRL